MVAIFTTSSSLCQIYSEDDYTAWRSMVRKLGKVFIDGDIPENPEDPLFVLDSAIKIDQSKQEFIKSIEKNPQNVLKEPCGIYLLDISPEVAKDIQVQYGVICQSTKAIDKNVLTHIGTTAEIIKGERGKVWKDIFKKFKTTPSNSVLIIDAHLFDNDQYDEQENCYSKKYCNGILNLKEILEQILPSQFSDTYHVGVLLTNLDEAKASNRTRTKLTNDRIATKINKLKKKIMRPYMICIEVIFFSQDDDNYKLIHNRRILTNTYVLNAQYRLAAFLSNGKGSVSQSISVSPLFELIHMDTDSDMKQKRLCSDLKEFHNYIDIQCNAIKQTGLLLYRNGVKEDSISKIQHRFLCETRSIEE